MLQKQVIYPSHINTLKFDKIFSYTRRLSFTKLLLTSAYNWLLGWSLWRKIRNWNIWIIVLCLTSIMFGLSAIGTKSNNNEKYEDGTDKSCETDDDEDEVIVKIIMNLMKNIVQILLILLLTAELTSAMIPISFWIRHPLRIILHHYPCSIRFSSIQIHFIHFLCLMIFQQVKSFYTTIPLICHNFNLMLSCGNPFLDWMVFWKYLTRARLRWNRNEAWKLGFPLNNSAHSHSPAI